MSTEHVPKNGLPERLSRFGKMLSLGTIAVGALVSINSPESGMKLVKAGALGLAADYLVVDPLVDRLRNPRSERNRRSLGHLASIIDRINPFISPDRAAQRKSAHANAA